MKNVYSKTFIFKFSSLRIKLFHLIVEGYLSYPFKMYLHLVNFLF